MMAESRQSLLDMSAVQLVEYLDDTWPARCIGPDQSEHLAHRYAGKRELIDTLKIRIEQETKKYGIHS
jgi:hypothetical protein